MKYQTNAPKGAALLTSRKPGWFRGFELTDFDINSIFDCVLAKLFGEYSEGLRFLFGEDFAWNTIPEEYGFIQEGGNGDQLQVEWEAIITDLQLSDIPALSEEEMRGE